MHARSGRSRRFIGAAVAAVVSVTAAFTAITVSTASATTPQSVAKPYSAALVTTKITRMTTSPSTRTTSPATTQSSTRTPTPTSPPATPATPPSCSGGGTAGLFGGQWYCPGYVIGVKTTAYGIGAREVISGWVVQVSGSTVVVEGGPSCLPNSGTYCGQIIPDVATQFGNLTTRPRYGDVISLYGVTAAGTMNANGYVVTGYYDPAWG